MAKKPCILVIRDGWGINPGGGAQAAKNGDATLLTDTPFHDYLYEFACHEGNYSMAAMLTGARFEETQAGQNRR